MPYFDNPTARTFSPKVEAYATDLLERLNGIRNSPQPDDTGLRPLSQKQLDRVEAFALRQQLRNGRWQSCLVSCAAGTDQCSSQESGASRAAAGISF